MVLLALALLAHGVLHSSIQNLPMFAGLLAAGLIASTAKIRLPGIEGTTVSVGFLVLLICVAKIGILETMIVMASSTILQCFWHPRKGPRPVQVLFSVANSIIASGATHIAGHRLDQIFGHSLVAMMMGAAIVYFFLVSFPIAAIVTLTTNKPLLHTWKETYVWSFPYFILGAALVGTMLYLQDLVGWQALLFIVPLVVGIYFSYGMYIGKLEAEKKQVEEMALLHLRTIESLALAIEAKDPNSQEHLRRVETFAVEIARDLRLDNSEIQAVRAAALLHDIGKLAVPEHIVS